VAKGGLSCDAAHELRNPMAPIAAAADLLTLGRFDVQAVKQASAVISRQVGHMTRRVDDLFDVAQVTRGLVVLYKASIDIKLIVLEAIEQVRPSTEAREHQVIKHEPEIMPVALRPLKMMVVDDNVDAARMLAMLLETLGHEVHVKHDSHKALEAARIQALDAFSLDIGLPGMDGIVGSPAPAPAGKCRRIHV
jgi:signal transduction histidine kinase